MEKTSILNPHGSEAYLDIYHFIPNQTIHVLPIIIHYFSISPSIQRNTLNQSLKSTEPETLVTF